MAKSSAELGVEGRSSHASDILLHESPSSSDQRAEEVQGGSHPGLLYLGPFFSMFDRFAVATVLVPIATDLHEPLSSVTSVVSVYLVLYGAVQVICGLISDRIGRVRILRLALLAAAIAGTVSASAPNLATLIVGRALTGAALSTVVPTSLVYIGDSFPFPVRQRAIADLLTAIALGTATASLGAGLLAHYLSWRVAFLLPAIGALILVAALRWLPEPGRFCKQGHALGDLGRLLRQRLPMLMVGLGLAEGAGIFGFGTFLSPALQAHGQTAAVAGLIVSSYGCAVLVFTRIVKRVAERIPAHALILLGGTMLVLCFALAAESQTEAAILIASALWGGSYAVMHSTFQTWATAVSPGTRGTATALFTTATFVGAGFATAGVASLAGADEFGRLFGIAALVTAPTILIAAVARAHFSGEPGSGQAAGPPAVARMQ